MSAENKKPAGAEGDGKRSADNRKKGGRDGYSSIKVDVSRPNKAEMDGKVTALIGEITAHNDEMKKIRDAINKINDATKGTKSETDAAKATMNALQAERKVLMDERSAILADRDVLRASQESIKTNEQKLKSELKFKDLESCEAKIKELERMQAQVSMTLNEEKKILKDIKTLQESKKHFEKLGELQGARDKSKQTKESIDKRYADKMLQVDAVSERIKAHKAVMDTLFGANSAQREGIPAMFKQIDEIKKEVNGKRDEISALRDAFKKAEDAYFNAIKEERKRQEAERAAEAEKRKAEKELREREAAEAELRRVPFEAEINLCDSVSSYLEKKVKVQEAFTQLTQRASLPSSSAVSSSSAADTQGFKVLDRGDKEEVTGNLKKLAKKGKRQPKSGMALSANTVATADGKKSEAVSHDADKLNAFAFLSVSPAPATFDDIPAALEALKAKKEFFMGLSRDNKDVMTFAAYCKKLEKVAEKEKKKETVEEPAATTTTTTATPVADAPPGLATPAGVKSKSTVFTVDQLSSSELFPTL
jgi:uncharacterized coiled-coil DUF342 family protein